MQAYNDSDNSQRCAGAARRRCAARAEPDPALRGAQPAARRASTASGSSPRTTDGDGGLRQRLPAVPVRGLLRRAEPARQGRRGRRQGSHRPAQRHVHRARRDPPARRLHRLHARRPDQPRRQPGARSTRSPGCGSWSPARHPPGRARPRPARSSRHGPAWPGGRGRSRASATRCTSTCTPPTARSAPALERGRWGDGSVLADGQRHGRAGDAAAGAIAVTASHPGSTSGTNASNRLVATAYGIPAQRAARAARDQPRAASTSPTPGQPEIWETDGFAGDVGPAPRADATSST